MRTPDEAKRVQGGQHQVGLVEEQRLGDLELQPLGRQSAGLQRVRYDGQQVAGLELARRQVDRDLERQRPGGGIGAGAVEHEGADLSDQPGLLRQRNEFGRSNGAALGMLPAHQRLEAGDGVGGEVDQWLVVDRQRAGVDRGAEVELQQAAGLDARIISASKKRKVPRPSLLAR